MSVGAESALIFSYLVSRALNWPGLLNKLYYLFQTVLVGCAAVTLFSVSLVSHGVLDNAFYKSIPPPVMTMHSGMNTLSVTSPYGLFRRCVLIEGL